MPSITIHLTDEQVGRIVDAILPQTIEPVITNTPRDEVEDIPRRQSAMDMLDEHGIPWHPEYHSSVKKLTTKGFWKRVRRGDKIATNAYEAGYMAPANPPTKEEVEEEVVNLMDGLVEKLVTNVVPMTPTDDIMPPALPMPMPTALAVPEPITYEAVLQAFKAAGERIGVDEATTALGEIYAECGVNPPSQLLTDESKRACTFENLEAL